MPKFRCEVAPIKVWGAGHRRTDNIRFDKVNNGNGYVKLAQPCYKCTKHVDWEGSVWTYFNRETMQPFVERCVKDK